MHGRDWISSTAPTAFFGHKLKIGDPALEVGDLAIPLFMAFATAALKNHRPSKSLPSFFYSPYWYLTVAVVATATQTTLMLFDLAKVDKFLLLTIVHFVLVPVYAVLVVGVVPIILFGVKDHKIARTMSSLSGVFYLVTLWFSIVP